MSTNLPEVLVCPICEQQTPKGSSAVYLRAEEVFTYSEPVLFYCLRCHTHYNLPGEVTHMGNKYRRIK